MGKKKRLKLERAQQETEKPSEKAPLSIGVIIFGVLLILSSLTQMHKLAIEKDWYFDTYSYMPAWLIVARYSFSWFQRFVGLTAAAGILARQNWGRILAFLIGAFTILTVYWKHPYDAVYAHQQFLDEKMGYIFAGTGVTFVGLTPVAVIALIATDIIFWGIFYFFFTRPGVRRQFKPGS